MGLCFTTPLSTYKAVGPVGPVATLVILSAPETYASPIVVNLAVEAPTVPAGLK
jgi:hypothetical protein